MKKKQFIFKKVEPYLYVLPAIAVIAIFLFLPMFDSVRYSFTNWNPLKEMKFTGLENYIKLFKSDDFIASVKVTFIWVIMSVVILPITGLIYAVLVEYIVRNKRWSAIMRTVLFLPMMMSYVAIGLLWQMIYDPNLGLVNQCHLVNTVCPEWLDYL